MKVLAISPHLDDAVVSAGGRIFDLTASGHEVLVWTMFARSAFPPYSPLAQALHELWKLPHDPVGVRRREDVRAVTRLGAEPRQAEFLDAIYRRDPAGWQFAEGSSLYSPSKDAGLHARLCRAVRVALSTRPDLVLTAAAIGAHVDHVAVRDAVLTACQDPGVPVQLWQDLPYSARTSQPPGVPPGACLGTPERIPMSSAGWLAKCAAVACYESQLSALWPGHADFQVPLAAHARTAGKPAAGFAETFWPVRWKTQPVPAEHAGQRQRPGSLIAGGHVRYDSDGDDAIAANSPRC
ncbi:MAG: PIG-L deacetylase family protein [Mycobacteriales bacterium]